MKIVTIIFCVFFLLTSPIEKDTIMKERYVQSYKCESIPEKLILELVDTLIQNDKYFSYDIKIFVDSILFHHDKGYMLRNKNNLFIADKSAIYNRNILIKDRLWLLFNSDLEVDTSLAIFPAYNMYAFRGTHHIVDIAYNEEIQDSIYSIVLPAGDNDYFNGYKFSKKYGFMEFDYHYSMKGERLNTICKCNSIKKFPLFNE
jgi:hypothetical protein